jgi:preprotein translocase subunit SecG
MPFDFMPLLAVSSIHYLFSIPLSLVAVFLSLIVLVQRGRGGGLTGALGGMGGQSAFGTKAGDLFTRITIVVAALWILLSMASLKFLSQQAASGGLSEGDRTGEVAPETPAGEVPATVPAAETPAAETPAAETPAAEKPAAEKPAAETPAAEAPATTPAAETPAAPATETPAAEAPAAPAAETPASDAK